MSSKGHLPIRMCVGCGSRRNRKEMMRLVRTSSGKISLNTGDQGGRSFYLCPDLTCLKIAQKRARRIGSWESVELDLLQSRILSRTEECRRNGNG